MNYKILIREQTTKNNYITLNTMNNFKYISNDAISKAIISLKNNSTPGYKKFINNI